MPNEITIELTPAGGEGAKLDADTFAAQLAALLKALEEIGKALEGKTAQVHYRIKSITTNSPMRVTIEPELAVSAEPLDLHLRHQRFREGLAAIAAGDEPPRYMTREVIAALREFTRPIGGREEAGSISLEGVEFPLTLRFQRALAEIDLSSRLEKGISMKGHIESINLHDTRTFRLYPTIGPQSVNCTFGCELIAEAKESFGQFVRVTGDAVYHWREKWPHEIRVHQLSKLLPPDQLPTFDELWGVAPNATGDIPAEEFVNQLRHGER